MADPLESVVIHPTPTLEPSATELPAPFQPPIVVVISLGPEYRASLVEASQAAGLTPGEWCRQSVEAALPPAPLEGTSEASAAA